MKKREIWHVSRTTWKNTGEYHDLHLKTDTLLLADVFENFRETCLAHYGLDPAHYYRSTGLSWDALLKMTGVELELLTDYDKYLFFQNGMPGGIRMLSKRYEKANNPMVNDYDPDKPNSWILYLDSLACKLLKIHHTVWTHHHQKQTAPLSSHELSNMFYYQVHHIFFHLRSDHQRSHFELADNRTCTLLRRIVGYWGCSQFQA